MKGIVYVALYINDNLIVGNPEAMDEAVKLLQENRLVIKAIDGLQNYLSCKEKFSQNKKRAWLAQHNLFESLLENKLWGFKLLKPQANKIFD